MDYILRILSFDKDGFGIKYPLKVGMSLNQNQTRLIRKFIFMVILDILVIEIYLCQEISKQYSNNLLIIQRISNAIT